MTRYQPRALRTTCTLGQVEDALFEAAAIINLRKKDLLKWPEDVEALHQYRISIRVARSLVKFLAPYQDKKQNRLLKDTLKQLQDPTSRMRELDVLVPEMDEWPDLQQACAQAQADTRDAFNAGMKAPETKKALETVNRELRAIRWNKKVAKRGIAAKELAARVEGMRTRCETTLETVDFDDLEAVHDLRKQAKALRYVARDLAACLPDGAGNVSGRMREVQDKLGEWCDARVDSALVLEICGDAGTQLAQQFQERAVEIMGELKDQRRAEVPEPEQDGD